MFDSNDAVSCMQAAVAFAAWLEAGDAHVAWQELTWLIAQGMPLLLSIIRMVPGADDVDLLRCAAFLLFSVSA